MGGTERQGVTTFSGDDSLLLQRADGSIADSIGRVGYRPPESTWSNLLLDRCNFTPANGMSYYDHEDYFHVRSPYSIAGYGEPPTADCPWGSAELRARPELLYDWHMRAISIRCPDCGGKLSVSADARESVCEYCGSKSQIQRRTGFFERVEPPPTRKPGAGQLPMAVQRHSTAWIITLVAIPTLVVGLVIPIIASQRARQRARAASATSTQAQGSAGAGSSTALQAPEPTTMSWQSAGAAIFDVNGDGVMDVLGRILLSKGIERDTKLAAFDGATGEPLWMSEELKLHSDDTPGPFVITDDTLVFPPNSTSLRAFGTSDGAARWTTSLPEKLRLVCRSPLAGSIAILTEDRLWYTLALADGKLEALVWEGPCRSLQGDSAYLSRVGQLQIEDPFEYGKMALGNTEGMIARAGLFDMESEVTIALAYKYPGSEVPMLARYEHEGVDARLLEGDLFGMRLEIPPEARKELDRKWYAAGKKVPKTKAKLLWSVVLPSKDPLKAKAGAPSHRDVALQDGVVVASYQRGADKQALTAFDVADGTRLWEVELSGGASFSSVVASPEYVFVVRYSGIEVFGLRDGHLAYSIPK